MSIAPFNTCILTFLTLEKFCSVSDKMFNPELSLSCTEIESFKLEKDTLEKNLEELQNGEQLAAADRRDDQERLSSRISDLEAKNNEMSETMEKLNEDNGR